MSFKIATWNVNSINVRLPHVLKWLETSPVDVLALQEIKTENDKFPLSYFENLGYHVISNGQKTYNGVAIISKHPINATSFSLPHLLDEQKRVLVATIGNIRIINFYIPNGESLQSEKFQYKITWLKAATQMLQTEIENFKNIIVLGDFNIAPQDEDVHDPKLWQGHVLCSDIERQFFQEWLALGFFDTFRLFEQEPRCFSWWDYRMASFRRNLGLRIDHILASNFLKQHCQACWIDKTPRAWERPSDHTPVILELKGNFT